MSPVSLRCGAAAILLVAAAGCAPASRIVRYDEVRPLRGVDGDIVALPDFGRAGQGAAEAWIERFDRMTGSDLVRVLEACKRSCIRVAAHEIDPSRVGLASGVLIATDGGGLVVTAARAVAPARFERTEVVFTDGTVLAAERLARAPGHGDDAIPPGLAFLTTAEPTALTARPAPIGRVDAGDPVFLLGYPDRLGVDEFGEVTRALTIPLDSPLDPIPLVGRVWRTSPLLVVPVAGGIPLSGGGAEGAPLFNAKGEVVGIFTEVIETSERDRAAFTLRGVALEPPPAASR